MVIRNWRSATARIGIDVAHGSEVVEGSRVLGADVDAMLLELGFRLRGVEPITSLSGGAIDRSVFLLRASDGSLVKARRLPDASRAETTFEVSKDLNHPAFARILARRGRVVIEEGVHLGAQRFVVATFSREERVALGAGQVADVEHDPLDSRVAIFGVRHGASSRPSHIRAMDQSP